MPTAFSTLVRRAVFGIVGTDTDIQTLCNRSTSCIVQWRSVATVARPVLAYQLSTINRTGGAGDRRRAQVLMAGFAEGDGAADMAEALVQRAREILTPAAFLARGLDAEVIETTDRGGDPDDLPTTATNRARADLDLLIRGTAPQS